MQDQDRRVSRQERRQSRSRLAGAEGYEHDRNADTDSDESPETHGAPEYASGRTDRVLAPRPGGERVEHDAQALALARQDVLDVRRP